jgi:CRP-like cAMP-binding protein
MRRDLALHLHADLVRASAVLSRAPRAAVADLCLSMVRVFAARDDVVVREGRPARDGGLYIIRTGQVRARRRRRNGPGACAAAA